MERTLSLVLDDQGLISLTLMKDEADKIDTFTIKNFENSEQIREFYKEKIDKYLVANKGYIEAIQKSSGKLYRGRIVILEARGIEPERLLVEKRVLYEKHLVAFKTMAKDGLTMNRFIQLEHIVVNEYGFRRLISPFLYREIRYTNFKVKSRVDFIIRELRKNRTSFYDNLRIISKAYEIERQARKNLKTIDAIYKEYVLEQANKPIEDIPDRDEENYVMIDGVIYPISDFELFDIEQLRHLNSSLLPDGLGDIGYNIPYTSEPNAITKRKPEFIDSINVNNKNYDIFDVEGLEQISFHDEELGKKR